MCSHYQALKDQDQYGKHFGVAAPPDAGKYDLWPGSLGVFIRQHPQSEVGDEAVLSLEALNGLYGLVPHWATDTTITRSTYNCRSETGAQKPSFREVWRRNQRCIVPAQAFFEPDWRSGRAVATRIEHVDREPLGLAGLWSASKNPRNGWVHSFTVLTINADGHALMNRFHQPTDEKRMVVILPPERYAAWLQGMEPIESFMLPLKADLLNATSAELPRKRA